jgi:hypothetical protein
MTRARMQQLNLEVSLFLSNPFHSFENKLLPNDVIMPRMIGDGHEVLGERCGGGENQQVRPSQPRGLVQLEFESASAYKTRL